MKEDGQLDRFHAATAPLEYGNRKSPATGRTFAPAP